MPQTEYEDLAQMIMELEEGNDRLEESMKEMEKELREKKKEKDREEEA
jgi:hypothetical protein